MFKKINFLEQYFYRQHYFHRHSILVAFFVLVFALIIFKIVTSFLNESISEQAQTKSTITQSSSTVRGDIKDRNGVIIAGNSLVSTIVLSPPSNVATVGFDNVSSIWRVNEKCTKEQDIYAEECKYKNLATKAKALWKNNQADSELLTSVNPVELLTTILGIDDLTEYVNTNKQPCTIRQQTYQDLKAKNTNKKVITQELAKLPKCVQYKVLKKNLPFTGATVQKIQELQKEKFLVCKTKEVRKGNKQKIIDWVLGWAFGVDDAKIKTSCWVETIKGIHIINKNKRFYSQSPSTTPIIGALNSKNIGVFGLERSFNSYLQETKHTRSTYKTNNSWHNPYTHTATTKSTNTPNNDLTLTIDSKVQFHLFNAIKNSVIKHNAKQGAGIIIDTNGEIIALASFPTSDANIGINSDDNYSHYLNRPLSDNLDVASTIKPFIALSALESGVMQKDELLDIQTGEGIKQFKPESERPFISISDIIKESHGLGSIKIGNKIDDETLFNHLTKLQFGVSIGVLPEVETSGFLRNFYYWTPTDKKRVSFGGYGVISSSLAQIARAYGIFANDGVIKNLKLFPGTEHVEEKIFSSEHIAFIKSALIAGVNEGGTGKRAKLNDHIAFGKTGTAQLLINGKYSNSKHNTIFAGIAPSNQPKYIMVVNVEAPEGYYLDGGSVAAPIFKEVMDKIL